MDQNQRYVLITLGFCKWRNKGESGVRGHK